MPAGTPSIIATRAGPCDSPAVSQRNTAVSLSRRATGAARCPSRPALRTAAARRAAARGGSDAPTALVQGAQHRVGPDHPTGDREGQVGPRLAGVAAAGCAGPSAARPGGRRRRPGRTRSARRPGPRRPAGWRTPGSARSSHCNASEMVSQRCAKYERLCQRTSTDGVAQVDQRRAARGPEQELVVLRVAARDLLVDQTEAVAQRGRRGSGRSTGAARSSGRAAGRRG